MRSLAPTDATGFPLSSNEERGTGGEEKFSGAGEWVCDLPPYPDIFPPDPTPTPDPMPKSFALTILALTLGVAPLTAQQVPTVSLGVPTARIEEPYTSIAAVRELADGRVLVVDSRDKLLQLVDLRSGSTSRIGREGAGPGEYRSPSGVFPLPNGEALLADPAQARFLRIDAVGKVVETLSYPEGIVPGMRVRATDAAGRVYFEGASLGMPGGGPDGGILVADSLPVIRWDRSTGKVDSLMLVKGPQIRVAVSGQGNSRNFGVRRQPFSSRDGWTVGSDGRIVVVRSDPYRVDTRSATGERTRGAVVALQEIPVTQTDKDAYLKAQQTERRSMSVAGDGRGAPRQAAPSSGPPVPPPGADEFDWPARMPYFDAASVQMSPTGELWSERTRVRGDDIPVYDVFSADGRLVRRVTFPARTRLIGFGAGTLYAARSDEDDLQYLERYRVP